MIASRTASVKSMKASSPGISKDATNSGSTASVSKESAQRAQTHARRCRTSPLTSLGVSVRGCLALLRASRTWAAAHGRHFVTPDDVKALAEPVLAHRILLDAEAEFAGSTVADVLGQILADIAPPERRGVSS